MSRVAKTPKEEPSFENPTENALDPDEYQHMVAEAAYYKAEKRGFAAGDEQEDWLEAEQEIMEKLEG